jgi:hypothetical protein
MFDTSKKNSNVQIPLPVQPATVSSVGQLSFRLGRPNDFREADRMRYNSLLQLGIILYKFLNCATRWHVCPIFRELAKTHVANGDSDVIMRTAERWSRAPP